ncbi:MAG: hypothetical protein BWK73_19995 [Thiothrix lacustris]|uniref:Uncharacterized protein n=1 Tax=Thiothrix lacustris TaxID=525917 RepID=A0A1Y1QP26_9GAMM|nr:MAG: hypothetical protein BWK73_19995 [Thiothrix lacustris]
MNLYRVICEAMYQDNDAVPLAEAIATKLRIQHPSVEAVFEETTSLDCHVANTYFYLLVNYPALKDGACKN